MTPPIYTITTDIVSINLPNGLADAEQQAKQMAVGRPGQHVMLSLGDEQIVTYFCQVCPTCYGTGGMPVHEMHRTKPADG